MNINVQRRLELLAAIAALGFSTSAAAAQEICVACTKPDTIYRCQIAGAEGAGGVRFADRVAQYVCISELAKQGGHATCAVKRDGFSTCLGDIRVVQATSSGNEPAVEAPGASAEKPQAAAPETGPPKTMLELAKRTGEASKEQMDKTGAALGGAMKKTWDCLTSVFSRC